MQSILPKLIVKGEISKMLTLKNVIIAVITVSVIAIGVNAFARGGMGWGGGWGHHGPGWHHGGGYGAFYGGELSKEEYAQLEEKREAFFKATQDLRSNLFEKQRELQSELAKSEPDAAKASQLQKEISDLRSKFDQKRIDHMIEMQKSNPGISRGFMRGGPMMGYGPCWE